MITEKQRTFYAIWVGILFISGAVVYGLLALFANFSPLIIYIFLGGSLLGGLTSGGILFGRYISRHNSVAIIVVSCVFFPITVFIIMVIGVFPLIPYYIYNLISLIQMKKYPERMTIPAKKPKKSPMVAVTIFSVLLIFAAASYIIDSINEANTAQAIFTKTGYPEGSPDNAIIRAFFCNGSTPDYSSDMKYDYTIVNGTLFTSSYKNGNYNSKIFYPNPDGKYYYTDKYQRSYYLSGKYMRSDIDKLFSEISLVKKGNKYAFLLSIDARSYEEHKKDWIYYIDLSPFDDKTKQGFKSPEALQFAMADIDRTFADPQEIELHDESGKRLNSIELNENKYVAFCDAILSGDKEYKVTISYKGETFTLLTYDDIINFKIGS